MMTHMIIFPRRRRQGLLVIIKLFRRDRAGHFAQTFVSRSSKFHHRRAPFPIYLITYVACSDVGAYIAMMPHFHQL